MQEENLFNQVVDMGEYLLKRLDELKGSIVGIRNVRGRGAMVGVELHQEWSKNGIETVERFIELGFILDCRIPFSTFRLFPPYIVTKREIHDFLQAFRQVLMEKGIPVNKGK